MPEYSLIAGALWLGILTSISPCPLATNIASVAFLTRRNPGERNIIGSALAYTLGRMSAYSLLAIIITAGLLSAPQLSSFFRSHLEGLIGPGLLIVGMFITGLIRISLPGSGKLNALGTQLAERGHVGEFLMGAVFALAFCPVSAALFFGALLPGIIRSDSSVLLPVTYGIGTAVPVLIAVALLSGSLAAAQKRIQTMQNIGAKLQMGTGVIILLVGAWITLRDIFAG